MSLFRRGRHVEDGPADPHLAPLSVDQAEELTVLAREAFAELGIEVSPDGEGALETEEASYGLRNLAATVSRLPRRKWARTVRRHVRAVAEAMDLDPEADADDAMLLFKLRPINHLDETPSYAPEVLPGILLVSAVDYPTHVQELLSDEHVEEYGGWPSAYAMGLANLRSLPSPHHSTVHGPSRHPSTEIHMFQSEDFFGASRIAILPELLAEIGIERPAHGVMLTIPNRHLAAVHVISGDGLLDALRTMIRIGHGEHDGHEGAISPEVFYRAADGETQQLTWTTSEQSVELRVSGRFGDVVQDLNLVLDPRQE